MRVAKVVVDNDIESPRLRFSRRRSEYESPIDVDLAQSTGKVRGEEKVSGGLGITRSDRWTNV